MKSLYTLENNMLNWLIKNKNLLFLLVVSIIAILFRINAFENLTGDYKSAYHHWCQFYVENGGFQGLSQRVGDYSIPYNFIFALFSYIPIKDLYLLKGLSCIFDFLLAFLAGKMINLLVNKKNLFTTEFCAAYTIVLLLPTVFMNSAVWGQNDSIYVFFCLLCLYYILKDKNVPAFIFIGVALSYKLQAIFIIPFIVMYYASTRKCSILHFALSFFSFWAMSIPGFIFGRHLLAPFGTYLRQSDLFPSMYCNFPSIWVLFSKTDHETLRLYSIVLTMIVLGLGLIFILDKKIDFTDKNMAMLIATWSTWTCVLILPSMHERYSYIVNILLLLIVLYKRTVATVLIAIVEQLCSIATYSWYLYDTTINLQILSVVYVTAYIAFSIIVYKESLNINKKDRAIIK